RGTGTLAQHAQAVGNIGEKVLDGRPAPDLAAVLLSQRHIPKLTPSSGGSFFSRHPPSNQLFYLFFEVCLNLVREIAVDPPAQEQLFHPLNDSTGDKTRVISLIFLS